ncbi:hypothetical protein M1466_03135 [Candidatus Dependentiae bacterium]|nr:hypothetical protein [Candidatus Dependentiae bacterium]
MKNLVRVLTLLLSATASLSAYNCTEWSQAYWGIIGGIQAYNGAYTAENMATKEKNCAQHGATSGDIGGVIGLRTFWCEKIFLNAEGELLYNSLQKTIRSSTDTTGTPNYLVTIKNNIQGGVSGRIGYAFCDEIVGYLVGAIDAGRWQVTLGNQTATPTAGIAATSSTCYTKTAAAGRFGIGIWWSLTEYCQLRLETSYLFGPTQCIALPMTSANQQWQHTLKNQALISNMTITVSLW